jgi:hypothetical protein
MLTAPPGRFATGDPELSRCSHCNVADPMIQRQQGIPATPARDYCGDDTTEAIAQRPVMPTP